MTAPRITEMEITLGALKKTTLFVNLESARSIGEVFGGFVPAWQRIANYDAKAYVQIIALGSGMSPKEIEKAYAEIERNVFDTGLPDLRNDLDRFLNLLTTGGRPPAEVIA